MLIKVLLIDDSQATNFFNKKILERTKKIKEIRLAEHGRKAISILDQGYVPDLIFLDLRMPVMDGWDFLEVLGKRKNTSRMRLVLMHDYALTQDDLQTARLHAQILGEERKMLTVEKAYALATQVLSASTCAK